MTDWAIPQQAKLKYTQLFNLHDRGRSGYLSGVQCRDILLQSGLPRNVLAEIWNLSDIDGDGQLTREEFILAMHLTNNVRSGQTLPTKLPADLIPPSYRRTRSISTASIHSTTSGGSGVSGNVGNNNEDSVGIPIKPSSDVASAFTSSILTSNSFEDKRRENFEKGRAELERRRLKMIEQQRVVLVEQLMASKKQALEAKAKIDSMRTERDTKMGLITSLEAQLQTLKERKAYLHQEEHNLIALAKDLNLVDPAQAELDHLATQAKQQSIDQIKLKIEDFVKEKDDKAKNLNEVTKRIEESKKELKAISELVSKTYKNYKEKVASAKVLREQFINESKSQAENLDSVWDSAPSFVPNLLSTRLDDVTSTTTSIPNEDPWASASASANTNNQPSAFSDLSTNSPSRDLFANINSEFNELREDNGSQFGGISENEPTKVIRRFRASFAFEARNPDELTINPGDIIVASEEVCEPGWLSGESNGRVGLFPEAYVEPLVSQANETTIKNSESPQTKSVDVAHQSDLIHSNLNIKYKVVFAFDARNSDELTINPGDVITSAGGAHEPGWLMGELDGKKGLFPESYVEVIQQDQPKVEKSRSKRAEVATVIANYQALGQEQLNLEKGQLVLIRRKIDSGWWEGEIQVKGKKKQFGWFPSSYVKLLSNNPT